MITLYTTHCPRCTVLAKKLQARQIQFDVCEDQEKMISLGMMSAPALDVDGELMTFEQANKWLNEYVKDGDCAECRLN